MKKLSCEGYRWDIYGLRGHKYENSTNQYDKYAWKRSPLPSHWRPAHQTGKTCHELPNHWNLNDFVALKLHIAAWQHYCESMDDDIFTSSELSNNFLCPSVWTFTSSLSSTQDVKQNLVETLEPNIKWLRLWKSEALNFG